METDIATIEDVFRLPIEFVPWERLNRGHVEYFIARLQEQGLAPSTINRKVSTLRQLIKFAYYDGLIEERAYRQITDAQGVRGERVGRGRAYTTGEVVELLQGIDTSTLKGMRDKALLALLFTTGMRRSELVSARVEDLTMDVGRAALRILGKGNKERIVPLRADVKRLLDEWLAASGRALHPDTPLFCQVRKFGRGDEARYRVVAPGKALSTNAVYNLIRKYTGGALTPHDGRRSFVTMALDAGATYQQVAQVTGHASTDMVATYERRRDAMVNSAVDKLDLPALTGR
jgi:integrase